MAIVCPVCGNSIPDASKECPSCGYRHIEATLEFKPVEVSVETNNSADAHTLQHKAKLRVIRGPQINMEYSLVKTVSSLGRNPKCDIFLNDMTVSREHALIAKTNNGYVLIDRNSYNGSWVNNKAVDNALLHSGDILQIGVFCLEFLCE